MFMVGLILITGAGAPVVAYIKNRKRKLLGLKLCISNLKYMVMVIGAGLFLSKKKRKEMREWIRLKLLEH